jgi:hypothetical protein
MVSYLQQSIAGTTIDLSETRSKQNKYTTDMLLMQHDKFKYR